MPVVLILKIVAGLFGVLFTFGLFFIVKQKTAVIIERLGKFQRVARSGFNLKIPIMIIISA